MKTHKFKTDLDKGLKLEQRFIELFPATLVKNTTSFSYDFLTTNAETVELKSDGLAHKTGNFFFERFSCSKKKNAGGPWQSAQNATEYFIYWFVESDEYFVFSTSELVSWLNQRVNQKRLINVPNEGYITQGYLFNKDEILSSGLCLELEESAVTKSTKLKNII